MSLTNAEKEKLDNTCGNLRVTKLGTHVKTLEDFVNQDLALKTNAKTVVGAINELRDSMVNKDCEGITIPPPGFFTLFGNDDDGKLYVYYNDEEHPPVFRHIETPGELEGTLYLYIADPEGENHYEMEIGHYIAVKHLDNYYTKAEIDAGYAIKNHAVNASTYGLGTTGVYGHNKLVNNLNQASHQNGLALSAYQGKVLKDAVDAKAVTVEKQSTAESGYSATYVVKQNNAQVGVKINIPKDFLVKSASLETCTTANVPVQGFKVGDKYIDWVVNTVDSSENAQHLYLNVTDLIDVYTADGTTLQLSGNQFSIKDGGVGSTQLASNSVITAKIKDGNVTTAKIKDSNITTDKIADSNVTTAKIADGAVTNAKVDSITKSKISDFSHDHGSLTNAGALNSDITSVNKIAVTDSNNNLKTISKLPANKVTHQDISGKIDTAGTGLAKSGTTLNHSNSVNAQSTAALKKIAFDAQGHITGVDNVAASDLPITVVDIVSDGNSNPVSSNAVYDYIDTILGDINDYITS